MAVDEAGKDVLEVGLWIDVPELAALHEGREHRPVLRALDGVGIQLQAAVVEEED